MMPAWPCFGKVPLHGLQMAPSSLCPHMGEGDQVSVSFSSYKDTNPIMRHDSHGII